MSAPTVNLGGLPPKSLNAVDVISPALDRTKRVLMAPFRWSRWWRTGLLALATGEVASSGGCNFNVPNFGNVHPAQSTEHFAAFPAWAQLPPQTQALIITTLVVGSVALVLVHMYIASVLRFVLFDAVTTEQFRIMEGWRRRHPEGLRFYGFSLLYWLAMFIVIGGLGALVYFAFKSGGGSGGAASLLVAIPLGLLFFLGGMLFFVMVKDFAVPMMALEDWRVPDAIGDIWSRVKASPGDYAAYIGMKAVLTLAAGILFGVIDLVLMLVIAIPVGIIAAVIGISVPNLFQSPAVIALAVTALIVGVFAMLIVFAIIGSPATMFFESYAWEFFGSRYAPLWALLHPLPPAPPATAPPPQLPPEFPPDAAPA